VFTYREARVHDPNDVDDRAIEQLARLFDLKKPIALEFSVVAPDREAGEALARVATGRGYETELLSGPPQQRWVCRCVRAMLVTRDNVTACQQELDQLGAPFDAHMVGWGTHGTPG
jgi:hypothetical protein